MNPTMLDRRPITNQFILLLQGGTGQMIGDGRLLKQPDKGKPWAIVYSLPGTRLSGPEYADPEADATFVYQVTSVGASREQCEGMQDLVRRTVVLRNGVGGWMVAWPKDVTDPWDVIGRVMDEPGGGIDPAGQAPNLIFSAADRFTVTVTPS